MGRKNSKNKKNQSIHKKNSLNNKDYKSKIKNKQNIKNNQSLKKIYFYYKGVLKIISYKTFCEESIKKLLKNYYSIEESIDQIFFQDNDDDDDILILNSNIPNDISVILFVRKDFIPKNPKNALKISNNVKNKKPLLKFHWVLEDEEKNTKFQTCIVNNEYTYKNIYGGTVHPSANSSISFTTGTHFFVIRVGSFQCYQRLAIINDDAKNYKYKTFIGFHYMDFNYRYGTALDIAIYIDMDRKKCKFYDYEKKKIMTEGKIINDSVMLNGWLKCGRCREEEGMTILNEGCIPVPKWVKK